MQSQHMLDQYHDQIKSNRMNDYLSQFRIYEGY